METADNSFGHRIDRTSVQISVEGLGTQCEKRSAPSTRHPAYQDLRITLPSAFAFLRQPLPPPRKGGALCS